MTDHPPGTTRVLDRLSRGRAGLVLAWILAVAAGLRGYRLGEASFWYDETVTMRLALAANPAELIDRLMRIDATRAPLHPLLLEGWIRAFGASESAARALSVLCGLAAIALVFEIGRAGFDTATGLWAAWLAALSPALIVYSREARMYAWLVLATAACWRLLLVLRDRFTWPRAAAYIVGLAVLGYSHPLGLIMMATLALAGLAGLRPCFGTLSRWLVVHLAAGFVVAPWVVRYLDHAPEFLSGVQPIKSLLGTPIGFIGGDSRVLGVLVLLIGWGIARGRSRRDVSDGDPIEPAPADTGRGWLVPAFLLLWLIVPPVVLYVYSRLGRPIFGPQRYTVFVAPAYLLLAARGLVQSPAVLRYPLAAVLAILALMELGPRVYDPDLKADWRGFAADLAAPGRAMASWSSSRHRARVRTSRWRRPGTTCRRAAGRSGWRRRRRNGWPAPARMRCTWRSARGVGGQPCRLRSVWGRSSSGPTATIPG